MQSRSEWPSPWTGWPSPWTGTWVAGDGKTVRILPGDGGVTVTVNPRPDQPPYCSASLLRGGRKRIERLPATCHLDEAGRRYLEVEAGTPGLGPTYRLYAAEGNGSRFLTPPVDLPVEQLVLIPEVSIGLYDDWDDDLVSPVGVPARSLRQRPG